MINKIMSDNKEKVDAKAEEAKNSKTYQSWVEAAGNSIIKDVTYNITPSKSGSVPANSSGGGNLEYDNALRKWKKETENYWKARNNARDTGGVFMCVEPPSRPDYADHV